MNDFFQKLYHDFENVKKEKGVAFLVAPVVAAGVSLVAFFLLQHQDGFCPTVLILIGGACILCSNRFLRAAWLLLLAIFCCVERHFILHYGSSFRDCGTQALITLNITDKDEILSYVSLIKPVEYVCIALFIGAVVVQFVPKFNGGKAKSNWRRHCAGVTAFFCLVLFAGITAYSPVRSYLHDVGEQREFLQKKRTFRFHAVDGAPDSPAVHFLVIGESHRKDEFDAIVLRGGAPVLTQAKREGALYEFDDMISYYQQTWFSVFTLLSRRGAQDMATNFAEKGLLALFREAGWKVYYVTYQPKTLSVTGYDCVVNEADVYVNAREETGEKLDNAFFSPIDRILKKRESKVLIVVKMVGCHFHFADRYPQKEPYCRYVPAYRPRDPHQYKVEDKAKLVNTYRNAMAFSAEVLDGIVRRSRDLHCPSFFFFLSDHGIINFDDGRNPFFGAAKSNFHVPCVLYVNEAYRRQMSGEVAASLKKHRTIPVGNDYVFDTLVSLAKIKYPSHRPELDLTSPALRPAVNRRVWVWKKQMPYDDLP